MAPQPAGFDDTALLERIAQDDDLASASYDLARSLAGLRPMPDFTNLPPRPETAHLRTIGRRKAPRDIVSYSQFLYDHGFYRCALTFLDMLVGPPVEGLILAATCYRKLAMFEEADKAWDKVDLRGYQERDRELELRAVNGKGLVAWSRGKDLAWALNRFSYVVEEGKDYPRVWAGALLNRGIVLHEQGLYVEAALDLWAAHHAMKPGPDKWSALTSLGVSLRAAGHFPAASLAFSQIIDGCEDWTLVTNAQIGLLELTTLQGDSIKATTLRLALDQAVPKMGPSMYVDYEYTLGLLASHRGQPRIAVRHWQIAAELAKEFDLGNWVPKIQHVLTVQPPIPQLVEDRRLEPVYAALRAA